MITHGNLSATKSSDHLGCNNTSQIPNFWKCYRPKQTPIKRGVAADIL